MIVSPVIVVHLVSEFFITRRVWVLIRSVEPSLNNIEI